MTQPHEHGRPTGDASIRLDPDRHTGFFLGPREYHVF